MFVKLENATQAYNLLRNLSAIQQSVAIHFGSEYGTNLYGYVENAKVACLTLAIEFHSDLLKKMVVEDQLPELELFKNEFLRTDSMNGNIVTSRTFRSTIENVDIQVVRFDTWWQMMGGGDASSISVFFLLNSKPLSICESSVELKSLI